MNKVAIGFLTKDRVELSKRTLDPLLNDDFDLFWFDGSTTPCGQKFFEQYGSFDHVHSYANVRGGADPAVVFALTTMLRHPNRYTHVGLCENDVLLHKDWFGPTMALFQRGAADYLEVGAVSARAYEDRVLIQRDGYAVMHNLGWGTQIMTRKAAEIALRGMRTGWAPDNRRIFSILSGRDVGAYWAFRGAQQWITPDWNSDALLARHGLASLALTPSLVEMIGQDPPLHQQGLRLVDQPVDLLRDDKAFELFANRTASLRNGGTTIDPAYLYHAADGPQTIFAHQLRALGGEYGGDWRLRWVPGFGGFAWRSGDRTEDAGVTYTGSKPMVTVSVYGNTEILCAGGKKSGAQLKVEDLTSGLTFEPVLPPDNGHVLQVLMPSSTHREIKVTALTPDVTFYGLRCEHAQPVQTSWRFDHATLPPV